jgi:UDP-N-acetylglucosamine/UDP-N-acetylgalactosamine diphosphorylase
MATQSSLKERYEQVCRVLKEANQEHLLRWFDELDHTRQAHLLDELESLPWQTLAMLVKTHVLGQPHVEIPVSLEPADVYPHQPTDDLRDQYEEPRRLGRELIAAGKVAAFTVAGGQGTRLGFDGPKGQVEVTPVGNKSLFCIFAGTIKVVRERYGVPIPWYIMTSPANHRQTLDYLRANGFFGLPEADVSLFSQAMLPAFDAQGRALLAEKHRLALAPDGHGGSLKALVASGALRDMQQRGIEIVSYFQVDNPLVKPFDPLFVGLHAATGSEMSSKVSPKVDDLEKVGNMCKGNGKVMVIEYSDLPDELAHARNADGTRKFNAGSLAIHMLNVSFIQRIVGDTFELPYRRAEKKVPFVDDHGLTVEPESANAVKLEMFVFDALPLAENPLVLEVDRAEEFSPVKNATGVDSLQSSKRDQNRRACRWLEAAGVNVPRRPDGEPDVMMTIAPSFAVDAEDVKSKKSLVPALESGDQIVLE